MSHEDATPRRFDPPDPDHSIQGHDDLIGMDDIELLAREFVDQIGIGMAMVEQVDAIAQFRALVIECFVCHLLRRELVAIRSEEHTSELQSLMRISYAVFCLKKKKNIKQITVKMQYS